MSRARSLLRGSPLGRVAVLAVALAIANTVIAPALLTGPRLTGLVTLFVPLLLAAMAGVPAILSGGGGLDLSVGPLLGFVNVLAVAVLVPHGLGSAWYGIPLCLLLGAAVGAVNGVLVAYVRLQPIVATLGSYLVLAGLSLVVLPQPRGGAPAWAATLGAGSFGGHVPNVLLLPAAALLVWWTACRTGLVRLIRAVGSDQRAAYTAGVDVGLVRIGAYTLGGLLAALAGMALTALIDSGDPGVGKQYTLIAVAAVALGGNSLAGGTGGITGPALGAATLFLIQLLLSALHMSSLWIQVVYGAVLLAAICLNSRAPNGLRAHAVTARQGA
ncbi:ABC transporter permease [Streptomyces sp. TS71-3]|uniref:ABC transporter permease n=1 Tax=Streptomyces sp. TS71-3 TaxID=2733862 RepID=UPI001B131115|nr:ABC transporter permease [Streptomyces sp. TS71-3]GHJ38474.1 ABC transporter permease [Streptomyces sp. TS71-3]